MSTRITLYGVAITPYTIKVMRALQWKGLPFALEEPQCAEDFRRWSPRNGLLPVVDVDGTRVQDSGAILDLLDQLFPEPPLLSSDPKVAHEQRGLERWVGETFFFHLLRWVRSRLGTGAAPQEGVGPLMRLGLIGPNGQLRREVLEQAGTVPEFEGALGEMTKLLGARTWFFADRMSRADLAVFGALQGLVHDRYPGGAELLRAHPTLLRHSERVEAATTPRG
jgi:glutathione S-transferase